MLNSIPIPGKFKIDHTGLTKNSSCWSNKKDRTGLTNILKPEQLLKRPVSIKRPGLYFLKKSLLNNQVYLNFKF